MSLYKKLDGSMAVWKKKNRHRRKPWRTFRKKRRTDEVIRKVCAVFLVLELAFFVKQFKFPLVEVHRWEEHEAEGQTEQRKAGPDSSKEIMEILGFRLRIEEGVIEIYRKEEIKNIH